MTKLLDRAKVRRQDVTYIRVGTCGGIGVKPGTQVRFQTCARLRRYLAVRLVCPPLSGDHPPRRERRAAGAASRGGAWRKALVQHRTGQTCLDPCVLPAESVVRAVCLLLLQDASVAEELLACGGEGVECLVGDTMCVCRCVVRVRWRSHGLIDCGDDTGLRTISTRARAAWTAPCASTARTTSWPSSGAPTSAASATSKWRAPSLRPSATDSRQASERRTDCPLAVLRSCCSCLHSFGFSLIFAFVVQLRAACICAVIVNRMNGDQVTSTHGQLVQVGPNGLTLWLPLR